MDSGLSLCNHLTSVQVYASSAVHSACEVGFERAMIRGVCSVKANLEYFTLNKIIKRQREREPY